MSIIIFLIALAVLILVHEFGHFITAKKSGVRVDEFGIGFPPKLFGKKYGETEYTFNLIPFGGFVKIFGENPDEESLHGPDKKRSFVYQPKWRQAMIIFAGVFFNFIFAWALISIGFMSGMPMPVSSAPSGIEVKDARVVVTGVEEGTPAKVAGISSGDALLSFSTSRETLESVSIENVQAFIARHGGEDIDVVYMRGGETIVTQVIPRSGIFSDVPAIGISMDEIGIVSLLPHRAIWEGGKMSVNLTVAIAVAFGGLIVDVFQGEAELSNLTGPIGIIGLVGDAAGFGFAYLLGFIAFISLNLAVLNLLPIPALDGGRLFFLAIETVKGSPLSPRFVNTAHMVGFIVLILLMVVVTYHDIIRLF